MPTFGGKGRYLIPVKIIKSLSSHEYQVNIPIKYNNLEENSIYYVDFRLIKLCESNTWNVILSDLKSIKRYIYSIFYLYIFAIYLKFGI